MNGTLLVLLSLNGRRLTVPERVLNKLSVLYLLLSEPSGLGDSACRAVDTGSATTNSGTNSAPRTLWLLHLQQVRAAILQEGQATLSGCSR